MKYALLALLLLGTAFDASAANTKFCFGNNKYMKWKEPSERTATCLMESATFRELLKQFCAPNKIDSSPQFMKFTEHEAVYKDALEAARAANDMGHRHVLAASLNRKEIDWQLFGYRTELEPGRYLLELEVKLCSEKRE